MSTFRETKEYQGISADQAYKMAESALDQMGFDVWKKRPLGWLLMADFTDETGKVTGNVSCRPGAGASITITLDSDLHQEAMITKLAEDFFSAIDPGEAG
jgi:hypothetical protein